MKAVLTGIIVLSLWLISLAAAADLKYRKPAPADKCAVCGMFVAKYPDFAAQIITSDGKAIHFDGTKDMFTYYLDPTRYGKGVKQQDFAAIWVTSYYALTPTDARKAWFVIGSDVTGPMGKELLPFAKEAEAQEFKRDHKGTAILRFKDINLATIKGLN